MHTQVTRCPTGVAWRTRLQAPPARGRVSHSQTTFLSAVSVAAGFPGRRDPARRGPAMGELDSVRLSTRDDRKGGLWIKGS